MDKSRGWSQKVLPECPVQCTYDPLKILQVISLLICRSEKEETTSVMSCWHWGWISLLWHCFVSIVVVQLAHSNLLFKACWNVAYVRNCAKWLGIVLLCDRNWEVIILGSFYPDWTQAYVSSHANGAGRTRCWHYTAMKRMNASNTGNCSEARVAEWNGLGLHVTMGRAELWGVTVRLRVIWWNDDICLVLLNVSSGTDHFQENQTKEVHTHNEVLRNGNDRKFVTQSLSGVFIYRIFYNNKSISRDWYISQWIQ